MNNYQNQPNFYGNLSGLNIYDWENLLLAYRKASKGKRGLADVAAFEYKLEDNVLRLQHELKEQTYQPGAYHSFYIHDPKKRLISAAPFRDRVVHHALCNLIEPIFEKSFISDSYANRIGKGTHKAINRAQQFARRFKYVLTCDVKQFFPSIDHEILKTSLRATLLGFAAKQSLTTKEIASGVVSTACVSTTSSQHDVLLLIEKILQSGAGVLQEEYEMMYFEKDNLFAINRPRGLPIGNLTSQFWANCYLNPFDHFVKRQLRCKGYIRYVDDFLLFSNSKQELNHWRKQIIQELSKFRLTLHENKCQGRPVTEGIPFLGFIIFPNHKLLKQQKGIAFQRKYKILRKEFGLRKISFEKITSSVQGWVNHVRYADTWRLRLAIL